MYETLWGGFYAPFSIVLSNCESKYQLIDFALKGVKQAILLSNIWGLSQIRDAFINLLSKSTNYKSANELKVIHIESLKTLLELGYQDPNNMGIAWK